MLPTAIARGALLSTTHVWTVAFVMPKTVDGDGRVLTGVVKYLRPRGAALRLASFSKKLNVNLTLRAHDLPVDSEVVASMQLAIEVLLKVEETGQLGCALVPWATAAPTTRTGQCPLPLLRLC